MTTHWALDVLAGSKGYQQMTRYVDPSNNADKYRRFVAIAPRDASERKMLLTQTGRWIGGTWTGGTWRVITEASARWERQASVLTFLVTHVERKIGKYHKVTDNPVTLSAQDIANLRASNIAGNKIREWVNASPTAPAQPGAGQAASGADAAKNLNLPTLRPAGPAVPAFTEPETGPRAAIKVLLAGIESDPDEFRDLARYQKINAEVVAQRKALETQLVELDQITTELKSALLQIIS